MLHFRQWSVNAARGSRWTAGVALAAALLWSVQAFAAPGVGNDSAPRGKNDVSSQPARSVSGDPAQIDDVVAGGPAPTAILAITPVPAKVGSYPPGTSIVGNELRAEVGGFRAWFEVQLSNWDPNGDNVPPLKVYQIKMDCIGDGLTKGFMNGKGAPLATPVIPCTADAAGDTLCRSIFGESWAKCEGCGSPPVFTCKAGYLDKSGVNRPGDNWCAPDGCDAGDVGTCINCNYNYFSVYSATRTDGHIKYYGGTLVLDIPAGAKGKYVVDLNQDETFLAGTCVWCDVPSAEENGFVVNIIAGQCCFGLGTPDQGCVDGVLRSECGDDEPGPFVFTPEERCPPEGPDCGRFLGACCDTLNGQCASDTFEDDCQGAHGVWTSGATCDEVACVGACCDRLTGQCEDDVAPGACQGSQHVWTRGTDCRETVCVASTGACCDYAPFGRCTDGALWSDCQCATCIWGKLQTCAEIDCEGPLGACCDTLTGRCADGLLEALCSGSHRVWTRRVTCSEAVCVADPGACCNHDPFGACTDGVTMPECTCDTCTWHKLQACGDIDCAQSSIPTISGWGLGIMSLLLLTGAKIYFGRSKPTRRSIGSLA